MGCKVVNPGTQFVIDACIEKVGSVGSRRWVGIKGQPGYGPKWFVIPIISTAAATALASENENRQN
jgi:hypothetical protein